MARKKTSSQLKSQVAQKAWKMILTGSTIEEVSDAVGYVKAAIRRFSHRKYKEESRKLWSLEVRAFGECEICGNKHDNQAHHILEEDIWPHLSRDISNGICLCSGHHEFNTQISPHKCLTSGQEFIAWLEIWRNGQWLYREDHKTDRKYIQCDYETAYHELK